MKLFSHLFLLMIFQGLALAQSLDDIQNQSAGDISDSARQTGQNYYHLGKEKDVIEAECLKNDENKKACNAEEVVLLAESVDRYIAPIVTKAYPLLVAATEKIEGVAKEDSLSEGVKQGDKKTFTDFCKYIATGTELVASTYQSTMQTVLRSDPGAPNGSQRSTLLQAQGSHNNRSTSSYIQSGGFAASAVCHLGQMTLFTSGYAVANPDFALILTKIALASGLSVYYGFKGKAETARAEIVEGIVKKLPKAGDCNPISDRLCYCSHRQTRNDPQYCLPEILERQKNQAQVRYNCIDSEGKSDLQCKCLAQQSCLSAKSIHFDAQGRFVETNLQELSEFDKYFNGQAHEIALNGEKQFAATSRKLKDMEDKIPDSILKDLNKEQTQIAKNMQALGLPEKMARLFATGVTEGQASSSKSDTKSQLPTLTRSTGDKEEDRVLTFSQDKATGGMGNQERRIEKSDSFDLAKFLPQQQKKGKGEDLEGKGKVLQFEERALEKAAIGRQEDSLFERLSRSYQKKFSYP
jgi:hypothetical protein